MESHQDIRDSVTVVSNGNVPVPSARPLSDFAWEQIDDDIVSFAVESMQYHSLNRMAKVIWNTCDGVSSIEGIAAATNLPVEVIEITIAELGEASLL